MADTDQLNASDAAEKAYAAAASERAEVRKAPAATEAVVEFKPAPALVEETAPAPVEVKPAAPKAADKPAAKKVVRKPAAVKVEVKKPEPATVKVEVKKAEPKPAAERKPTAKPAAKKAEAKKAERKPAADSLFNPNTFFTKLKDSKMATTTKKTTEDLTARFKDAQERARDTVKEAQERARDAVKDAQDRARDAVKDAQERAKTAFEKSQALMGDAGEFTKGNLDALVQSGKILRSGVGAISKAYVENAKSTVANVQADVKELRTVKTPTDFVKLQGTMVRKYVDTAVTNNSKRTEAVVKLANEAIKPISNRVTFAVEKFKKAA